MPRTYPPSNSAGLPSVKGSVASMDLKSYFRQLERRFLFGLLMAFLIPLISLSAYFHFQFQATLKETGKLNLTAVAESQRNTVDLFLQERLLNIFSLFRSSAFGLNPTPQQMQLLLQQLQRAGDAFVDVGFLTEDGYQVGYAGPYPYLQNLDYSVQDWFLKLMSPNENYYISDIYLGFRNKPHFTIAAKQLIDGCPYVLRATLDPDKFRLFLMTISHEKGVKSILINQEGRLQLSASRSDTPLSLEEYLPPLNVPSGAIITAGNGDATLVAHAWLSEVNWVLLVSEPLRVTYAQLYRARQIMLISSTMILAVVVAAIGFATHTLIGKACENAEKRDELYGQLLHASKLASLGELATGVAHEINNPLAIIVATTGAIRDTLNPEFKIEWTPETINEDLKTIDTAVFRARGITQQLLDYGRKNSPRLVRTDLNRVLEEVLAGFKEKSLALADVDVVRDLDAELPAVMADPDQIRQVFLNLINNAGDAIDGPGKITISTRHNNHAVQVIFTDTGRGMEAEQIKKIFDPFFTTKDVGEGTGLGLSVSIGLVDSMGGTIEVQSMPGVGSAFTVILPIVQREGVTDGQPDTNIR